MQGTIQLTHAQLILALVGATCLGWLLSFIFSLVAQAIERKRVPGTQVASGDAPSSPYNKEFFNEDLFLIVREPENPNLEERRLARDIVILDHRAHHQLQPKTREWDEVLKLLINVGILLQAHDAEQGRAILKEAQRVYYHHNQTRNRIRYLAGAVAGIVVSAVIGAGLLLLSKSMEHYVERQLLVLMFVFAGLGSIASVLTRISKIDLRDETSNFSVIMSGFSRPLIAIFFALVVYFILDTHMLEIKLGSASEPKVNAVYLVTSFLCGFSERFAKDIISRVSFGSGTQKDA